MIELSPADVTSAIRALCPTSGHTWRRCFAVLDGSSRGRTLTDDPEHPSWAAVQEFSDDSVLFLTGALDRGRVAEVIERQRHDRVTTIGVAGNDPLLALLPANADNHGVDIDFEDRDPAVDLEQFITPPSGLRLARIDAALVPRCLWPPWMTASNAAAVDLGLGYCLLDGERVVSEAFAGPVVGGALEMATITVDAFQRLGLATVVCARTILECERSGYQTWWNTGLTNLASAGLARKLGYRSEQQYRVLVWRTAHEAGTGPTA